MDLILIGTRNFSVFQKVLTDSGTHPASNSMARGLNPAVERPGSKADNSPPSKIFFKNYWSYFSIPLYNFIMCTGIIRLFIYYTIT